MLRCPKCDNDMRTSHLMTPLNEVMLAGTIATDPQPIAAQVCNACGYIELYTLRTLDAQDHAREAEAEIEELPAIEAPAVAV